MSTAEPLPDNIRRIAVLVASVDSGTARQLLLHLPTAVAKQVRRALQNLGPITPAERQRILTEFQSTAARQIPPAATNPNAAASPLAAPVFAAAALHSDRYSPAPRQTASLAEHSERMAPQRDAGDASVAEQGPPSPRPLAAADNTLPSWQRMDIRALCHLLRGERSTVIAVVINQLPPETGVALLQQLPVSMHREILLAIATLQDFDAEAMQAIEEHLAERLKDYELQIRSEAKGTRRVAALLAAAPQELQETWARFVHLAVDSDNDLGEPAHLDAANRQSNSAQPSANASHPPAAPLAASHPHSLEQAMGSHVVTTADLTMSATQVATGSNSNETAHILPFPAQSDLQPLSATDRSLIQLEFEQILTLSTQQLAQVLTAADSQTVLLALAGASPSFMKRFYAMLSKLDAKALASRLSQIGPLKLRDIDEAQRAIAELAGKLTAAPVSRSRTQHTPSLRVAA